MKLVKWLLLAIIGLVVLPVAVLMLVLSQIDPNQFKPKLVDMVSEHTRGRLEIQGDIAWTFWPTVGVEVKRLMYRLPEDGEQPLVAVSHVVFGIAAMPLLHGALEVDSLRIDGVHLALEKDAKGNGNWERVMKKGAAPAAANAAAPAASGAADADADASAEGAPARAFSVNIARIDILNTSLRYREPDRQYFLQDVSLNASNFNLDGGAFPLALHFKVEYSEANGPRRIAVGNLDGRAQLDAVARRLDLVPATVALELSGDEFGERVLPLTLDLRGGLDARRAELALEKWDVTLASLRAGGDLRITDLGKPTRAVSGRLEAPAFSLVELLSALGVQPPAMADASALQQVAVSGRIAGDASQLMLEDARVGLDGTQLAGRLGIGDLERGQLVAELDGDRLDLDRYLAAAAPAAAPVAAPAPPASALPAPAAAAAPAAEQSEAAARVAPQVVAQAPAAAAAQPLAPLRGLESRVRLGLKELKARNLHLQDVKLAQNSSRGVLVLDELSARLYGGTLAASGQLDLSGEPRLKLRHGLAGVQLQPLLKDYRGYDKLEGVVELKGELGARGNPSEWMKTLSGPVEFRVASGVLHGTNLERKVCEGIARVRGQALSGQWPEQTRFDDFSGRFQFASGVGRSDSLGGGLPNLKLSGEGAVDLAQLLIDYRLGLRLTGDTLNQDPACAVNPRYSKIDWPVRCQGPLGADPKQLCQLDQGRMDDIARGLLKGEAKRKLKKKLGGKLEKLDPAAREKLQKALPGLLQ